MLSKLIDSKNNQELMANLVVAIIVLVISTILLRYMWNESLVKHISILKPVSGFKEALILSISLSVLKCC